MLRVSGLRVGFAHPDGHLPIVFDLFDFFHDFSDRDSSYFGDLLRGKPGKKLSFDNCLGVFLLVLLCLFDLVPDQNHGRLTYALLFEDLLVRQVVLDHQRENVFLHLVECRDLFFRGVVLGSLWLWFGDRDL